MSYFHVHACRMCHHMQRERALRHRKSAYIDARGCTALYARLMQAMLGPKHASNLTHVIPRDKLPAMLLTTSCVCCVPCVTCVALRDSQPFRSRASSLPGANRPIGPWPIRSLELSFLGPFAPWPFRSLAFSLHGTFAPRSEMARELSFPGTFALRSIRSQEHSLPGTFVPC